MYYNYNIIILIQKLFIIIKFVVGTIHLLTYFINDFSKKKIVERKPHYKHVPDIIRVDTYIGTLRIVSGGVIIREMIKKEKNLHNRCKYRYG